MAPRKSFFGWTDAFLLVIILLNVLDFLEIIGSELDYVKKILSWVLLGHLLYRASPTKVFFGQRRPLMDTGIVLSYFLLIVKDLVWYANTSLPGASYLRPFFSLLVDHASVIEQFSLVLGVSFLVFMGLWSSLRFPFRKRSVMGVLHEEGEPGDGRLFERSLMTLLVLLGFFVMVFNMMMEWLAIAVDAPLLLAGLFLWSVLLFRRKVNLHGFLERVGNVGSGFYSWFIDHFRYRETFLLGILGLLVLHLLTDVGIFLVPYIIGIRDPLYLSAIPLHFSTVWEVWRLDWSALSSIWQHAAYAISFLSGVVGFVVLFVSPAIIWRHLYHRRHPRLPRWLLVVFFTSLPSVWAAPLFAISGLDMVGIAGVDVQLRPLLAGALPLGWIAALVLFFLSASWALSASPYWRTRLERLWVAASVVFFSVYAWTYFVDVFRSLVSLATAMLKGSMFVFALIFLVFQALMVLFYGGGLFILVYELVHRTSHRGRQDGHER